MSTKDELKERLQKLDAGEIQAPQGMTLERFSGIQLTVAQLRKAVKANPEHPIAKELLRPLSVYGPKDENHKITMSRVDVEALLDNKEVRRELLGETIVDGSTMPEFRKVLGDTVKVEDGEAKRSSVPGEPTPTPERTAPTPEKFDKAK